MTLRNIHYRINSSRIAEGTFAYLLIVPLVLVLSAIVVFPTLYSFWVSLYDVNMIIGKWRFVGSGNYIKALSNPDLIHAFWITLLYTVQVTSFSIAVSVGGALLLNEKFVGRETLTTIVVLPWAVSTYATAVIWRYMYSPEWGFLNGALLALGLVETPVVFLSQDRALTAMAIAHSWQISPLGMYLILASLKIVPEDLYKAAKIDRLGVIGRFRHVSLPYIRGPILIILCLLTAEATRVFDIIYFMTGGGPGNASSTVTWEVYRQVFTSQNVGYGSSVSWMLVLMTIAITSVYFMLLTVRSRNRT